MKFFFKLLLKAGVTLGVLFVAYRFLLPNMDGFQMSINKDKPASLGELGAPVVDEEVTVYQWTDAQGVTHFGGTPPTGQGTYKKKEIQSNANVVQAIRAPEEEEKEEQRSRSASVGSVYSPEGVKDLLDEANDMKKQMEDRKSQTDDFLDSL